jgi:peptidoglycan hydrolase-like protein with peptidoglycan-binding domain
LRLRVLIVVGVAAMVFASPAGAYVNAQHAGLQVALRALGLYHGDIDGLVGPQTVAGVRAAQRRAHLPVTGLADKRTRWSLGPLGRPLFGSRVMRTGIFGYDVSVLQFLLTRHGVYNGPLDGYMSTSTAKALRRYQRQVDIASDGVVGPRTVASLVLANHVPVRPQRVSLSRIYVVKSGDSLTAIARRFHVSLRKLARANRLGAAHVLLIGAKLRIPGYTLAASTSRVSSSSPALTATPTEVRDRLDYWAGHYGVSPHLMRALAWMESGYQPNVVSKAGARGVLQTLPVTRDFVEQVLVGHPLPRTLDGDIETGVLYLRHLLGNFGGSERFALAAWYQGEKAVREHGIFKVTKPFVAGVLALKARM